MKSAEFKKLMTKNDLPSCILLAGEDVYFVDSTENRILELLSLTKNDLDYSKFDGERLDDFLRSLSTPPFLAEKRVSFFFLEKPDDEAKAKLEKYAASPNPDCVAVVVYEGNKKLSLGGFLSVDCGKEGELQIVRWIVLTLKKNFVTISEELAREIATRCDKDMSLIKSTTDVLLAYKGGFGEITRADIDDLVPDTVEAQVFDLVNAIVDKNVARAAALQKKLEAQKTDGTAFIAMMYNYYRRMFFATTSGASVEELAKTLNVKEFAVKKAKEVAAKYSPRRIKDAMEYLASAEENTKSGGAKPADAIKDVLFHLIAI